MTQRGDLILIKVLKETSRFPGDLIEIALLTFSPSSLPHTYKSEMSKKYFTFPPTLF